MGKQEVEAVANLMREVVLMINALLTMKGEAFVYCGSIRAND